MSWWNRSRRDRQPRPFRGTTGGGHPIGGTVGPRPTVGPQTPSGVSAAEPKVGGGGNVHYYCCCCCSCRRSR